MPAPKNNNRLLAILTRYETTPWRERYSLTSLFFNFYLLVMVSFIAIAFFADVVISTAVKGVTDDYTRRFMRGTVLLIEEDLFRKPRAQWPNAIKRLDKQFSYKLAIVDRWSLSLSRKEAEKLDNGELAVSADGEILYHRLKLTSEVLLVGPMSFEVSSERPRTLPLELRIRLLTWSLMGLCLAIVVWLWVRPLWRDLEAFRQTARALGEGNFQARAPAARSRPLELLTATLNGMAERIQLLIASQKELSSAISHELKTPIARMRFALEMLAETDETTERERFSLMMSSDLDELTHLIDSSLAYARFEREHPEPDLSLVELAPWLEEKVAAISMLNQTLEWQVNTASLPANQEVELDLQSMPYAITNLLRNAMKYAKKRISIHAEIVANNVCVMVDDDGEGILPEDRERIFTAFTRLDNSRGRSTGGYGLGLAIVRVVLEQHGGSATAGLSPLGGARFSLKWPLLQNTTQM